MRRFFNKGGLSRGFSGGAGAAHLLSRKCSAASSTTEASSSSTLSEADMEALGMVLNPKDGKIVFASKLREKRSNQFEGKGGGLDRRKEKLVSVVRPDLEKEFDPALNTKENWKALTMDSRYVATWKCSICSFNYKHVVADRVRSTFDVVSPCPSCKTRNLAQARHLGERRVVRDFQEILSAYANRDVGTSTTAKTQQQRAGSDSTEKKQEEGAPLLPEELEKAAAVETMEGNRDAKEEGKAQEHKDGESIPDGNGRSNTLKRKTPQPQNVRKVRELPEWRKLELQMTCWELLELTQGLVQAARGLLIHEYKEISANLAARRLHVKSLKDQHEAALSSSSSNPTTGGASRTVEDSLNDPGNNYFSNPEGGAAVQSSVTSGGKIENTDYDDIQKIDPIQQMSNKELARVMVVGYEIRRLNDLEALLSRSNAGKNFTISSNPDSKDLLSAWNETTQPITPDFLFNAHEQRCISQEFVYQRGLYDLAIQAGFGAGMVSPGAQSGHTYVDRTDPLSGAYKDFDPSEIKGSLGASRGKMSPFARFPAVSPGRAAPILNKVQIIRLTHLLRLWVDQSFLKAQVESEEASGGKAAVDDKPLRLRCRVVLLHLATFGQGERSILEQILTSKNSSAPTAVETKEELLVNIATCCIDNADSDTILQQGRDAYFWLAHPGGYQGQVRKQAREAKRAEQVASGGKNGRNSAAASSSNPEIQYEPNQGYFYYYDPDYQQYYYSYNGADYTDQQGNPAPYRDWGDEGQRKSSNKSFVAPRHIVEERLAQYQQQNQQQHSGGDYTAAGGGGGGYQQQQPQYHQGQQQPYYQQ